MSEDDARELLRAWPGVGGLEARIAAQDWQPAPIGWIVCGAIQGWRFRLQPMAEGLRITAGEPGVGKPAVWVVPGKRRPVMAR